MVVKPIVSNLLTVCFMLDKFHTDGKNMADLLLNLHVAPQTRTPTYTQPSYNHLLHDCNRHYVQLAQYQRLFPGRSNTPVANPSSGSACHFSSPNPLR